MQFSCLDGKWESCAGINKEAGVCDRRGTPRAVRKRFAPQRARTERNASDYRLSSQAKKIAAGTLSLDEKMLERLR